MCLGISVPEEGERLKEVNLVAVFLSMFLAVLSNIAKFHLGQDSAIYLMFQVIREWGVPTGCCFP